LGEGAVYRTVVALWRGYFDPPDLRAADIPRHFKNSKLRALPAIGAEDLRAAAWRRGQFRK